ncbi:MAG: hypothetical protein JWO82_3514 [Akkermansiaceae bacterium]|nr:hypothetical protein [Akkermansiaceae bacterium]
MTRVSALACFYFNGRELSPWASQWHLLSLPFSESQTDDWDEFISHRHIWHLQCRLDHTGVVESEDPLIFRICA